MADKILIVDTDESFVSSLKDGIGKQMRDCSVSAVSNGMDAHKILRSEPVSMVIAEFNQHNPIASDLLSLIVRNHPDLPCVAVCEENGSRVRSEVLSLGAIACIKKSPDIQGIVACAVALLNPGSSGGKLINISPSSFLQIIQIEERTCTITVKRSDSNKTGLMFFSDGVLMEAKTAEKSGQDAALEMLLWDEVDIGIHNYCPVQANRINSSLEALLIEATRLNDEAEIELFDPETENGDNNFDNQADDDDGPEGEIIFFDKICERLRGRKGISGVSIDSSWKPLIDFCSDFSALFDYGKLKTCYISQKAPNSDTILIPKSGTIAVSVEKGSIRDLMIDVALECQED
jgi:DNA-binding NarL/FixJ family response regulator